MLSVKILTLTSMTGFRPGVGAVCHFRYLLRMSVSFSQVRIVVRPVTFCSDSLIQSSDISTTSSKYITVFAAGDVMVIFGAQTESETEGISTCVQIVSLKDKSTKLHKQDSKWLLSVMIIP